MVIGLEDSMYRLYIIRRRCLGMLQAYVVTQHNLEISVVVSILYRRYRDAVILVLEVICKYLVLLIRAHFHIETTL